MKEGNDNSYWRWGLGVGLLGFFFLFLFEPPPDRVTFQCDRTKGTCTVEKSGFFRTKTQEIKIENIRYAHFDKFGWIARGYQGPDIKLQDGNDISVGTGSSCFFTSREQKKVDEINKFLSNTELKHLSVTHTSFPPTVAIAAIFLLGGLYSIYRGLRPYINQGLGN